MTVVSGLNRRGCHPGAPWNPEGGMPVEGEGKGWLGKQALL